MLNAKIYEYGMLSFSIDTWRHVYEGNGLGDDYTNQDLYRVFNTLAQFGWEPHLFYAPEPDGQVWVMRRLAGKESAPSPR